MSMFITLLPFLCMGTGLVIGLQKMPAGFFNTVDRITTISLIVLMVTIGGNVGTNQEVIAEIGTVGVNCALTCLLAIAGSVILGIILEKTILPLEKYQKMQIEADEMTPADNEEKEKKNIDPILVMIPLSVIGGALGCYFFLPSDKTFLLTYSLWTSLVILYTSVGAGMGQNKKVFGYLKLVGFKVVFLAVAVIFGSMAGGALAALITGMPLKYAVIAAGGSGYYSMTGATMLSAFGAEAGVYGFMVNVFRDFFTVLLLPLLARISKSAPIMSGAGGNMDSMLVPVTRVVGRELGLIALIVGVIITFGVPVILPVLCSIFG